jgi:hypothetical protein
VSEPYAELELAPVTPPPTLDLGLRPRPLTETDDLPTRESDARAFRTQAAERGSPRVSTEPGVGVTARADTVTTTAVFDPIAALASEILDAVDKDAPSEEVPEDRTRRRLTTLFDHAIAYGALGDHERAVTAMELALEEDPESAVAQKLIQRNRDSIVGVFQTYLEDLERQPQLARSLQELAEAPISPRAAFLLSRVDGTLTIDEILDVSGMPRMEAYRYLCQLFLRGILK